MEKSVICIKKKLVFWRMRSSRSHQILTVKTIKVRNLYTWVWSQNCIAGDVKNKGVRMIDMCHNIALLKSRVMVTHFSINAVIQKFPCQHAWRGDENSDKKHTIFRCRLTKDLLLNSFINRINIPVALRRSDFEDRRACSSKVLCFVTCKHQPSLVKATLYPKTIFSLLLVIFLMISPSLFWNVRKAMITSQSEWKGSLLNILKILRWHLREEIDFVNVVF